MNNWFFKHKDAIEFGMILTVCVLMMFAHIREGSSPLNIGKWVIVIGLTIVLMIRNKRQKKNRG
jgi:hypothetical protein